MNEDLSAGDMSSPYRLLKAVDPAGTQAAFRKQLADSLAPLVAEVVSEQTRKLQQQLLVISAFLLLLSFSVIRIKGKANWNGIELSVVANSAVAITFAVAFYLEFVVTVRSLLDWSAWSIQSGAARLSLEEALRFSFANAPSGADSFMDDFREHIHASSDRYPDDKERPSDDSLEPRALERKLASEKLTAQRNDMKAKTAWIDSKVAPLRPINALRVGLEVLFPVLFGGVALVFAVVQWLK